MPPEASKDDVRSENPVLAITGATGFIGAAVAARFVAAGWRVRALVRNEARTHIIRRLGAEPVLGNLADRDALDGLVDGAAAVVHCAGAVRGLRWEDFERVNVDGVANVVTAAAGQSPCPLFVSLSSLAAREPGLSPYAATKRQGERVLERKAEHMHWVALRPPAVYGPGDPASLPLLRSMMRGLVFVPGAASNRFSLLQVDDLVAAIEVCLSRGGDAPVGVFELHDGRRGGYDWNDLSGIAAGLRGKNVRVIVVPKSLLQALAVVSATWGRACGRAPLLTLGKVGELTHPDWVCDNVAFAAAYGWSPTTDFVSGLRRTMAATESR